MPESMCILVLWHVMEGQLAHSVAWTVGLIDGVAQENLPARGWLGVISHRSLDPKLTPGVLERRWPISNLDLFCKALVTCLWKARPTWAGVIAGFAVLKSQARDPKQRSLAATHLASCRYK
ncbi:hypothetical protein BKA82DRAFT_2824810 [Pisolithus tinctorius]|nr:hypothetical protein BKA82DRAFT_2824810 [Pisolithus tinctorius]